MSTTFHWYLFYSYKQPFWYASCPHEIKENIQPFRVCKTVNSVEMVTAAKLVAMSLVSTSFRLPVKPLQDCTYALKYFIIQKWI